MKTIMFIGFLMLFVSCNSGGGEGSSAAPTVTSSLVTMGIQMDYPIVNLQYYVLGRADVTDTNGQLQCYQDEMVAFHIGDLQLGILICDANRQYFIHEMTGATTAAYMNHVTVVIETVDADSNPLNGYEIPEGFHSTVFGASFDTTSDSFNNPIALTLVNNMVEVVYPDFSRSFALLADVNARKVIISDAISTLQDVIDLNNFSDDYLISSYLNTTVNLTYQSDGCLVNMVETRFGKNEIDGYKKDFGVTLRVTGLDASVRVLPFEYRDPSNKFAIERRDDNGPYYTGILKILSNTSVVGTMTMSYLYTEIDDNLNELCVMRFNASCIDLDADNVCN